MKPISYLLFLILFNRSATAQIKMPQPQAVKKPISESLQILIISTYSWNGFQGKALLIERPSKNSEWKQVGKEFPIVVGRNGLGLDPNIPAGKFRRKMADVNSPVKQEGDGRSPAGAFPLTFAFGSGTAANTSLPFTALQEFTECVDDVNSVHYNTIVGRMQVSSYDWKSSEKMLEVGEAYERGVFVAYNSYPPKRGDGSCIFLHIWKDENTGTSGCTAMKRADLEWLLARLDPAKTPYLFQMPAIGNRLDEKPWKLPTLK